MPAQRTVVLVQLPIPPAGVTPVRGNVPLAAAYLKLYAAKHDLGAAYDIEILDPTLANTACDLALVEVIVERRPWMVGFTCYLWNVERSLWIAERVKQRLPDVKILIGGPEAASDNAWVLAHPAVDYASIGEGEQTFAELLSRSNGRDVAACEIDGLYVRPRDVEGPRVSLAACGDALIRARLDADLLRRLRSHLPRPRKPMPRLDEISSPYLTGILDAADEGMLLLETVRGCVFKCKFCYYPKSYDALYFLSRDKVLANLEHARRRGAREVVLLDPTLNQRGDFDDLLGLLIEGNPDKQFTYFGELRAEGIRPQTARLLRQANFAEVEIGLQSIDPLTQDLMDRRNHLRAFERGVRAMLDEGIKVKIDLIIGLPGDTVDSVRRGLEYLHDSGLYSTMQVFNLAVLTGTAFRSEAASLGLIHQARPPYYVLQTPTLTLEVMYGLMEEAEETFGIEFDPLGAPAIEFDALTLGVDWVRIDLDEDPSEPLDLSPAIGRTQAFTIWLRSADLHQKRHVAAQAVRRVLEDNPFTTLDVMLEPTAEPSALSCDCLDVVRAACFDAPSYLDRFYSVMPGRPKGAKRIVAVLPIEARAALDAPWRDAVGERAEIVWRTDHEPAAIDEWEPYESCALAPAPR